RRHAVAHRHPARAAPGVSRAQGKNRLRDAKETNMDILQGAFHDAFSPFALSFVLAAIGLNVHFGYTGLLNFGQAAFSAVGAYAMAVAIASFGIPLFPALLLGILAAILLALVLGVPTLRLRADYLA